MGYKCVVIEAHMALRPGSRCGCGGDEAEDNRILRYSDGRKRFHLGSKRIPSFPALEQLRGCNIEAILETNRTKVRISMCVVALPRQHHHTSHRTAFLKLFF